MNKGRLQLVWSVNRQFEEGNEQLDDTQVPHQLLTVLDGLPINHHVLSYLPQALQQIMAPHEIIVSESVIFGPIDYLSDIENLVLFERAMFADYSFKYRINIFLLFMSVSPLINTCLEYHEHFYQYILGNLKLS